MSEKLYKVIITPFAEAALDAYDEYLRSELFADQAADSWLDAFEQTIISLRSFPEKYQLADREPWHSAGIHMHPVKARTSTTGSVKSGRRCIFLMSLVRE